VGALKGSKSNLVKLHHGGKWPSITGKEGLDFRNRFKSRSDAA